MTSCSLAVRAGVPPSRWDAEFVDHIHALSTPVRSGSPIKTRLTIAAAENARYEFARHHQQAFGAHAVLATHLQP
ncbi:hypothetical protein GCM10011410_22110 [Hoyosella rhizosphaerae]|uniref:Uncharacterized protein n=1 Tax=Hoyosella rhizosphaerae TaxID=1755582 RepID=A0A916UDW0_9ACTN|nr:hypothetical protein GCM10011410_22110 [Hoyosella rhizosphaerae]